MSRTDRREPEASPPDLDPTRYSYELPEGRIAVRPARPRESAKLLVLRRDRAGLEHRTVRDLPEILDPGDLLVVNETRVVPARLLGTLGTGGRDVELLLTRETAPGRWLAFARPARSFKAGRAVAFPGSDAVARVLGREGEMVHLGFEGDVAQLIASCGHMPLPPYIRRPDDDHDREDYQTVFARVEGAVAAPTAGLHFTGALLDRLCRKGIDLARILLHVGPGTFRPIRVVDLREHRVDPEYFAIPAETQEAIARARVRGNRAISVGTTTVRALEGGLGDAIDPARSVAGWTDLTIVPPYEFRWVDGLMTNFHLPGSSLLLLVCAFGGKESVLAAYEEAVRRAYRFYSYGDAMLLL